MLRRDVFSSLVLVMWIRFDLIFFLLLINPYTTHLFSLLSLYKQLLLNCDYLFLIRDYLLKSQSTFFCFIIIISACHDSSKTVVLAVSALLANEAQFAHKPNQIELQLDQSQLPYSEYLGLIPQEAAQLDITKKAHYTIQQCTNKFYGYLSQINSTNQSCLTKEDKVYLTKKFVLV